jgi:hypothetical protein
MGYFVRLYKQSGAAAVLGAAGASVAASFLQCLYLVSFAMRVYLKRDEKEAEITSRRRTRG